MQFSDIEREVVILKAAIDFLGELVNRQLLKVRGSDPNCDIVFPSSLHQRLAAGGSCSIG